MILSVYFSKIKLESETKIKHGHFGYIEAQNGYQRNIKWNVLAPAQC